MNNEIMHGVNEYCEGNLVYLGTKLVSGNERIVVCAENQGGYDGTSVDLIELLSWIKLNHPELLEKNP